MDIETFCENLDSGNLQILLLKMSHMYFAASYEKLAEKGLHPGQVPMLQLLARQGGLSQREIAQELHVKPPSVAVSIRRMENAGLLVRTQDGKDQRVTRISLSEKGREALKDIQKIFEENQKILFRGFTESEKCLMRRFLIQMIKNMDINHSEQQQNERADRASLLAKV